MLVVYACGRDYVDADVDADNAYFTAFFNFVLACFKMYIQSIMMRLFKQMQVHLFAHV